MHASVHLSCPEGERSLQTSWSVNCEDVMLAHCDSPSHRQYLREECPLQQLSCWHPQQTAALSTQIIMVIKQRESMQNHSLLWPNSCSRAFRATLLWYSDTSTSIMTSPNWKMQDWSTVFFRSETDQSGQDKKKRMASQKTDDITPPAVISCQSRCYFFCWQHAQSYVHALISTQHHVWGCWRTCH